MKTLLDASTPTLRRAGELAYDVAAGVVGVTAVLGLAVSLAAPRGWR